MIIRYQKVNILQATVSLRILILQNKCISYKKIYEHAFADGNGRRVYPDF